MSIKIINTDEISVKSKPIVIKTTSIEIVGIGTIPIKKEYDLTNIPEKHHEICISMIENGM